MKELTTQISHKELIDAWAPICDVSMTFDRMKDKLGDGFANELFGFMDDKIKRALQPLQECIDRLERENPDQFGE